MRKTTIQAEVIVHSFVNRNYDMLKPDEFIVGCIIGMMTELSIRISQINGDSDLLLVGAKEIEEHTMISVDRMNEKTNADIPRSIFKDTILEHFQSLYIAMWPEDSSKGLANVKRNEN
mgnify:CR=1 FL=1